MRRAFNCLVVITLVLTGASVPARTQAPDSFAAQVAALSEPGGYFDTDNLISNERSYLDVVPELRKRGVRGGAYIGVGPDQNFSYIAAIHPDIAFIVDVRRDNLLLHLLFKSLFALSRTRVEYLALLHGRPIPANLDEWKQAKIERLVAYVDSTAADARLVSALRARVDEAIGKCGVPLVREDLATIDRFHRRFIDAGTELKFQSTGRPPQSHYPSFRDLLIASDASGAQSNYLASEEAFQFVKNLEQRDLIVPVVGDVSGTRAIGAIAAALEQRGRRGQPGAKLSAFYVSNVEFYLFGDGRFPKYVSNLRSLPRADHSVIIRSIFGRGYYGGGSLSILQSANELVDGFAKGRFQYYQELVSR